MRPLIALALTIATGPALAQGHYANAQDREHVGRYEAREADWRNGAVVYQVLVDRFVPPADLEAKRSLYPAPKTLRAWSEQPRRGTYVPEQKVWSHELDFWGGDLASLRTRLDYVQQLGADVLYLNPIHMGYTNHKYDGLDYLQISPEFGTRADVQALADAVHGKGMRLVLDGVFNHMGRHSPKFRSAENDPESLYRDWFIFDSRFPGGARSWFLAENLPELNLENPAVREHLWNGKDSVVRSFLRDGADGWRLDVAFEIGFTYLAELTQAAHAEKPGSLVVGEIANFPKEWLGPVDALMQFSVREVLLKAANGQLPAPAAQRYLERLLLDAPYEHTLKGWIFLDNHDTPRLVDAVRDPAARRLAQVLQFTLPGSPNLYYGSEVDMEGVEDPAMRGPMAWDRVAADHPTLAWTKRLIELRKKHRALRVGDYRAIETRDLIAFERFTDRAGDTVLVLANPSEQPVHETVLVANSKLMWRTRFVDQFDGSEHLMISSLIDVTIPPKSVRVLLPDVQPKNGYTNYKRVQ